MVWKDNMLSCVSFADIQQESKMQIDKHGIQERTPEEWLMFLTEEVGELAKEICDVRCGNFETEDLIKITIESIQVATLAMKIASMNRAEYRRMIDNGE